MEDSILDDSLLIEGLDHLHYPLPITIPLYSELLILVIIILFN